MGAFRQLPQEGVAVILCDREIQALLEDGVVLIEPVPEKKLWTSTAIDLTLHNILVRWTPKKMPTGQPNKPRPTSDDFNVQAMMEDPHFAERIIIDPTNGFELEPRKFVLGFTHERIRLPHRCRIAARVEGKSSLARLGLGVHVTAPTIHSGFGMRTNGERGSEIQLEIFNLGDWSVILDAGMPICQLIFEEVREVPSAGYRGQFSEQQAFTAPTPNP
jgi:dCTP deaminase